MLHFKSWTVEKWDTLPVWFVEQKGGVPLSTNDKKRRRERNKRELPKIEDTEFAKEKLVNKAIQRSYNQSGLADEPLSEADDAWY